MQGLRQDCAQYMQETPSDRWCIRACQHLGGKGMTTLGHNQEAISRMLWHATHTGWFEFHAESQLVHFWFPIRYWQMAQDEVPVFFEMPGSSMKGKQHIIDDLGVCAKTREEIGKVIKRRYLLTLDFPIKPFIKWRVTFNLCKMQLPASSTRVSGFLPFGC
jgi:hypothetical protein